MTEDLFVLLVPAVHGVPAERRVPGAAGCGVDRLVVGPPRVLGTAVTHGDRPVGRVTLDRAVGHGAARLEHPGGHVALRDVVTRHPAGLVQQLHPAAVGYGAAAEHDTDTARRVFEVEQVLGGSQLGVEHAGGPVPEWCGSDRQSHALLPTRSPGLAASAVALHA